MPGYYENALHQLYLQGQPKGTGTNAGGLPGGVVDTTPPLNYNPAFGGTPTVPAPTATAGTAVTGNLGNLADIYNLTGNINAFNTAQAVAPYTANLPNYAEMTKTASGDILSNLEGQLPADVMAQIGQGAAERGIATGTSGSPNSNAAFLRAMGLTSLDLQNLGQTQFTGAMARTPTAQPYLPQNFMVTPEQQQAAAAAQALYYSAPVPGAAAAANMNAVNRGIGAGRTATLPGTPTSASPTAATAPGYYGAPTSTPSPYGMPGTGAAWNNQGGYASTLELGTGESGVQGTGLPAMGPGDFGGETMTPEEYQAMIEALGGDYSGTDYYDEGGY